MAEPYLKRANRALLRAIETPPDTGLEPRIDRIAAHLWAVIDRDGYQPDPGQLYRFDYALATLATHTRPERAAYINEARQCIRAYLDASEWAI